MRRGAARALVVLASAVIVLALIAAYAQRAVIDSDQFANRATAALRDDAVRSLVAERITDQLVLQNQADLIAARPIIESVASGVVGSRAFTGLFRSALRDVHRALFDRDQDTVTLTVADVGTVLAAALEQLRPALARKLESAERVALIERDVGAVGARLVRLADTVRVLALLLLACSLALLVAALAVSPDRRHTVVELGIGVAVGGVLAVVAYSVVRALAIDRVEGAEARAAAGAVWDAFAGDLRTASWILAGSGAVIAAAAASLIRPVDLGQPLRRAADWLASEPQRPALRALRGVALVAVGLVVVVEREAALALVLTAVGVYLVYEGVTALLRLVYRPPAPSEVRRRLRVPLPGRRLVTTLIAAGMIAVAVAAFVSTGGTSTAAPAKGPCNGREELCERPLDRVVLPATHNSMSVPLPGWYSSEQDRPIADQLADGIRGLLVDTHYADRLPNGKLRTDLSRADLVRQAEQDGVSQDAVNAAMRLRDRLGFAGQGERGMYLCHTFCELGATELGSVLDDLHDFLVAHPDEVVVVINQDYVTPADFVGAVKDAGLEEFVYRGPTSGSWPTLRELIDRNQRIVFLAENDAGAASWYQLAYESVTEETPYTFSKVPLLTDPANMPASCKPNRGPDGAPLFLINHWITTDPVPLPSHAAEVNTYDPLLRRARECQRIRDHLPNLLAVNFYRRGDLFRVVDTLNGVG